MDKIILNNLGFYGYHGVLSEEKSLGQKFFIDVELLLDTKKAGKSDDMNQSVSYADVYDVIKDITENKKFNLIEALAENIASEVLEKFTLINQIKYKAKRSGIKVIMINESYTSGCSCIDDYMISKKCYNKKRRKKRGNFITNNDFNINADVNGAYNILRKYLKNDIPHCLIKGVYENLCLTYLNMYFGFKGNSILTGGLSKVICSPVLIHL